MNANNEHHEQAIADQDAAVRNHLEQLRIELDALLVDLLDLDAHLALLADSHQSVGIGFMTPEARSASAQAALADRAAVMGLTTRYDEPGHSWLNGLPGIASGPVPAPVTIPAVSASAEIHAAIAHNARRLVEHLAPTPAAAGAVVASTTPLDLATVHNLQAGDRTLWTWTWTSGSTHTTAPTTAPADTTPDPAQLAEILTRAAADLTGTTGLRLLATAVGDLTRARRTARDVVDGPAATPFPQPCPWCGRRSLVTHLRAEGRDSLYVRCEGTHPCHCDDQWCPCHTTTGRPHRHEWVNSGRAKNPIDGRSRHALTNLIAQRTQEHDIETNARDRLDRIRDLHTDTFETPAGTHTNYVVVLESDLPLVDPDHECVDDDPHQGCEIADHPDAEHVVRACVTCATYAETGDLVHAIWPCATYQLADLEHPITATTTGPATAGPATAGPATAGH